MATEFLNPQTTTGEASFSSLTLSSYVVPAGTSKKLCIVIANEDSIEARLDVSTCTFGGSACTYRGKIHNVSGFYQGAELWDYDLVDTTPTGDIAVTFGGSCDFVAIAAMTITEVLQQAPEAFLTADAVSSSVSGNITTITANAAIVDGVSHESQETLSVTGTGHTLSAQENIGGYGGTVGIGYVQADSAGSYTVGWSATGSGRFVQVIAAYETIPSFAAEQDSFRLYADGTESGSTALELQNVDATIAQSTIVQLRQGIQMTGDAPSLLVTLEYQKNGDTDWEVV